VRRALFFPRASCQDHRVLTPDSDHAPMTPTHLGPVRLALVTDAWLPQVNGVTTTLGRCVDEIRAMGDTVEVIHPGLFRTVPCPRYPEIRLAAMPVPGVGRRLRAFQPNAIHIATEGPLGMAARRFCRRRKRSFTTSYHTKFPEYLRVYAKLPTRIGYGIMRWFHRPARHTLVPTRTVNAELEAQGFEHVVTWTRGVDAELFTPDDTDFYGLPRPVFLYAGRVAAEKNIAAFLDLELPGSKVVVGDGPARAELEPRYPDVHWAGFKFGEELAQHYAGADVFVFPSRTDTFGVVMLEANAAGLPVAAYPVAGPLDVIHEGRNGVLREDLRDACLAALELDPADSRAHALTMTWTRCAQLLRDHLAVF
jgi:glycosyltransferase involved in cell wall biosynthesis